ncbi:MAG: hypothetical protein LAN36_12710 [Acidobacteriia bacterium]|nr:hypothetical protein [Terriglobia bacterium]
MRSLWRGIVRVIFWSYERGSWPYDVLVIAIVVFVLASPRSWFHDRPQSGAAVSASVELVSEDSDGQTRTYRVAAAALSPEKRAARPTPELERETHAILGRTVDDLKGRTFQVLRIDPVLAGDGSVAYYDVMVRL